MNLTKKVQGSICFNYFSIYFLNPYKNFSITTLLHFIYLKKAFSTLYWTFLPSMFIFKKGGKLIFSRIFESHKIKLKEIIYFESNSDTLELRGHPSHQSTLLLKALKVYVLLVCLYVPELLFWLFLRLSAVSTPHVFLYSIQKDSLIIVFGSLKLQAGFLYLTHSAIPLSSFSFFP